MLDVELLGKDVQEEWVLLQNAFAFLLSRSPSPTEFSSFLMLVARKGDMCC